MERLRGAWAGLLGWYRGHSARDQRILLGVAVAVVLSLVYVVVVEPVRDYRREVLEEIVQGHERLETAARFVGAIGTLRSERESLRVRLREAKTRLLPGDSGTLGAAALQERANALATESGITVQSTQVMRDEAKDPFRKVAVRLTLSGELEPLARLVSGLEHRHQLAIPFVEISRRGALVNAQGPRRLTATLEVNGFVQSRADEPEEIRVEEEAGEIVGPPAPPVGPPAREDA